MPFKHLGQAELTTYNCLGELDLKQIGSYFVKILGVICKRCYSKRLLSVIALCTGNGEINNQMLNKRYTYLEVNSYCMRHNSN